MFAVAVALLAASPACAQDRLYCPARPGLGDTPCTIAPGHVSIEAGLADWSRDGPTDTLSIGDVLARAGIGKATEIDLGWTAYARQSTRVPGGGHARESGAGDLRLGLRRNLRHPDGGGISVAVEPFVTLPIGRGPAGAGDWSLGMAVPAAFDLGHGLSFQSTTELDAATDEDGAGRHFAVGEVTGLGVTLSERVSVTAELEIVRDDDPAGGTTQDYSGLAFAWTPSDGVQLDLGAALGLDRSAAASEVYLGVSRRF